LIRFKISKLFFKNWTKLFHADWHVCKLYTPEPPHLPLGVDSAAEGGCGCGWGRRRRRTRYSSPGLVCLLSREDDSNNIKFYHNRR
jgi:hypothetical protein